MFNSQRTLRGKPFKNPFFSQFTIYIKNSKRVKNKEKRKKLEQFQKPFVFIEIKDIK